MTRLQDKNILITGGASGIGRLLATYMARRGANVVVWDINDEAICELVSELRSETASAVHGYACDVSDRQAVLETAQRTEAEAGPIDILINNAGIVYGKTLLQLEDDDIERTFRTNSLAVFWTTRRFLPGMVKRNSGHVVNIASAAAMVGVRQLTDYSASKAAVVGFHESLRMELKKSAPGIKTTLVCPFYVNTGMFYGVRTRLSWCLPILEPEYVARKIVRGIERNRLQIAMPRFVRCMPIFRMLPRAVFDYFADLIGVNDSMNFFGGRSRRPGCRNGARQPRKPTERSHEPTRRLGPFVTHSGATEHGDDYR